MQYALSLERVLYFPINASLAQLYLFRKSWKDGQHTTRVKPTSSTEARNFQGSHLPRFDGHGLCR